MGRGIPLVVQSSGREQRWESPEGLECPSRPLSRFLPSRHGFQALSNPNRPYMDPLTLTFCFPAQGLDLRSSSQTANFLEGLEK